jgi:hypothetical protein
MRLKAATASANASCPTACRPGAQFGQHGLVLRRIGEHRDVLPVLGRAAHHGRAADVDVLDGVLQRAAGLATVASNG